jgi:LPXTG-motif cell wall-anchored protein
MGQHFSMARKGVRRRSTALAVAGTLAAVVGALTVATAVGATGLHGHGGAPMPHKIDVCHATGSSTNPYVKVSVDDDSIVKMGHGGHEGPVFNADMGEHDKWGDIVPPFDLGGASKFGGQNWSGEGKGIFEKGCVCPGKTPHPGPTKPHGSVPVPPPTKPGKPTTTKPGSAAPTTTTKPGGAATTVAPTPTTVAVKNTTAASESSLPVTGSSSGLMIAVGVLLMAAGGGMLVLRRVTATTE